MREFRPGTFSLQNTGPTTVYTNVYGGNVYGGNVSTTPFAGSIAQYFAGNHPATQDYLRGATRDYAANAADQIHSPN